MWLLGDCVVIIVEFVDIDLCFMFMNDGILVCVGGFMSYECYFVEFFVVMIVNFYFG